LNTNTSRENTHKTAKPRAPRK